MGYLLLHSAFGPSSVQLREKTAREGKDRGDTEHGEDCASPRASRWAKMTHRQTSKGQGRAEPIQTAARGSHTAGSGFSGLPLLQPRLRFKAHGGHTLDLVPSPLYQNSILYIKGRKLYNLPKPL